MDNAQRLFPIIAWIMDIPEPQGTELWRQVREYQKATAFPYVSTPEIHGLSLGLSEGIEVSLKLKFGEPGLQLMPEIRALRDYEKLQTILHAIEAAASPEDLRRLWAG